MKKAQLREQFIELRRDMSPRKVERLSAKILARLTTAIDWNEVRRVHIYRSVDDWKEVRTGEIIRHIGRAYPDVALTVGDSVRSSPAPSEEFDVILIPLLAFDEQCNRLGFGGGWYDRFLAAQPKALKIGLAYGSQRADAIPIGRYDVPLDMVVTDSGVVTR